MSGFDLQEIIDKYTPPERLREALANKRAEFERVLAERIAAYSLAQANPHDSEESKVVQLEPLQKEIQTWVWAIEEIDRRLAVSAEALAGTKENRAARRRKTAS